MDEAKIEEKVTEIDVRLSIVEQKIANSSELLKQNIEVLNKLNESFQDNRVAMEKITSSLDNANDKITNLQTDVKSLKDERNFNFISYIKNNFIQIILAGYVIYEIVEKLV